MVVCWSCLFMLVFALHRVHVLPWCGQWAAVLVTLGLLVTGGRAVDASLSDALGSVVTPGVVVVTCVLWLASLLGMVAVVYRWLFAALLLVVVAVASQATVTALLLRLPEAATPGTTIVACMLGSQALVVVVAVAANVC